MSVLDISDDNLTRIAKWYVLPNGMPEEEYIAEVGEEEFKEEWMDELEMIEAELDELEFPHDSSDICFMVRDHIDVYHGCSALIVFKNEDDEWQATELGFGGFISELYGLDKITEKIDEISESVLVIKNEISYDKAEFARSFIQLTGFTQVDNTEGW